MAIRERIADDAREKVPKYTLADGLAYGADWHRYRFTDSSTQSQSAHQHGDALVLLIDEASQLHTTDDGAPRRETRWRDVLCAGRIAAATSKSLALTASVFPRHDAPPQQGKVVTAEFINLRVLPTFV